MGVRWEEAVFAVFDDLEMQAEGLYLEDREGAVAALAEAAYAEVTLAGRLHAAQGATLRLLLNDGADVRGRLVRSGVGWAVLDAGRSDWLVRREAVVLVEGLGEASLPESSWPLTARLSVGSVLRRIATARRPCVVRLCSGRQLEGVLTRVGADFVTVASGGSELVLPVSAVAAVQEIG
ncbi:MAG: hypothetical protein JWQ74_979 [Marmoricola sp.]|nr:hypothetical protein [Marmoricola sp.]